MAQALGPLLLALDELLLQDPGFTGLVGPEGFYAGEVPQGEAKLPYVSTGTLDEDEFALFSSVGKSGGMALNIWSAEDVLQLLSIYDVLERLLNRKEVSVVGWGVVRSELRFVTYLREPDTGVHHGVARWDVWTIKTA